MKKIILVFVMIFTTSIALTSCKTEKKKDKKEQTISDKKEVEKTDVYQCPMKCEKEKTYEKEGKCPVCEMKLRKKDVEKHTD